LARTLTAPTEAAAALTVTTPAYLVELGYAAPLRLSSRQDQSWNGQTWTGGRLGRISGLAADGSGSQRGTLEIINTDLAYSALILNEGAADIACRIWMFYGNNPAASDPVEVFNGVLDEADIAPDRVRLTLASENSRTLFSPRRFIGPGTGFNHLRPAGTRISWGGQVYVLERTA
jgi:hypothetical protein